MTIVTLKCDRGLSLTYHIQIAQANAKTENLLRSYSSFNHESCENAENSASRLKHSGYTLSCPGADFVERELISRETNYYCTSF